MTLYIWIIFHFAGASIYQDKIQVLLESSSLDSMNQSLIREDEEWGLRQRCVLELQFSKIPFSCYELGETSTDLLDKHCRLNGKNLNLLEIDQISRVSDTCQRILRQQEQKLLYIELQKTQKTINERSTIK